jgi:hypothetical protein
MRAAVSTLCLLLLACVAIGCGNERERGINRDKDRPRSSLPALEFKESR